MPDFMYEARARSGALINGTVTADNEGAARSSVDAKGLSRSSIQASKAQPTRRWGKKVKGRHIATLFSQLADLLHSGVPLLRSLEILERQSSLPALTEVMREI